MRPKVSTQLIAVSVALFFAFAGAISTAEAGRGGGHVAATAVVILAGAFTI